MPQQTVKMSPQLYARICGVLYAYILVAGTFAALFVRSKLVVSRDAAATAANIMAGESLFRLGFSAELLHLACDVAVAMLLYALLRPVDRHIALLAMKLHGDGYAIRLVFFGFACSSLGYLIFRSGYLPQTISALMAVAGACYLVSSFAHFLHPATGAALFNAGILLPCFVAGLSLTLWLLVKGVNVAQWDGRFRQDVAAR